MKIKIDRQAARRFVEVGQSDVRGARRRYYVTRAPDPALAIMVFRQGSLPSMKNTVVDANVGWDDGTPGFVLDANIGKQHTKITVYRRLWGGRYDQTLSQILENAPRASPGYCFGPK